VSDVSQDLRQVMDVFERVATDHNVEGRRPLELLNPGGPVLDPID
jgi:hypothetical protein